MQHEARPDLGDSDRTVRDLSAPSAFWLKVRLRRDMPGNRGTNDKYIYVYIYLATHTPPEGMVYDVPIM